jgi:uncharacterized protein (DUF58 family)
MMVPTNRFLFAVAALTALGAAGGFSSDDFLFALALFLLVVIVDTFAGRHALRGLVARPADVVRLSKGRDGAIPVEIENKSGKEKALRIGLPLPSEFEAQDTLDLRVPAGASHSRISFPCLPARRGRFLMDRCYLEATSPLGFWNVRKVEPAKSELRVYPNLMEERKKIAALFLNRGDFGIHPRRMVGLGREFEKLREYVPGDDFDQIHWKATARRGRPITKVYQIERTQEVYVVIDSSRLSARSIGEESTLEFFIRSGLLLGLVAQQQGDLFGALTFADQVKNFVRAGNGKAHYQACKEALYALQPALVTPDYNDLCAFIRLRVRHRALLVVLTDLNDPVLAENFTKSVALIARHHLVLVNMMRPPQARPLFAEADVTTPDDVYQRLSGHLLWENLADLEKVLKRRGVRLSQLDDPNFTAQLVSQYMEIKHRQLL